jgi:hypothetical protein
VTCRAGSDQRKFPEKAPVDMDGAAAAHGQTRDANDFTLRRAQQYPRLSVNGWRGARTRGNVTRASARPHADASSS